MSVCWKFAVVRSAISEAKGSMRGYETAYHTLKT